MIQPAINSGYISQAYLVHSGMIIDSQSVDSSTTDIIFTGLTIGIPAGQSENIQLYVDLTGSIDTSSTNNDLRFAITNRSINDSNGNDVSPQITLP
jgi:hypothetical protein